MVHYMPVKIKIIKININFKIIILGLPQQVKTIKITKIMIKNGKKKI